MSRAVAIIESDSTVKSAMYLLLESLGFDVVSVDSPEDVLRRSSLARVGCLIVGARGDGELELNTLEPLLRSTTAPRVIVIAEHTSTSIVVRAMRLGVSHFLEHPFAVDQFVSAIQVALSEHAQQLEAERKKLPDSVVHLLTPQEEEIAKLLVRGAATKEIAAKLDLSVRTIHYRKNNIYKKIGAEDREQATRILAGRDVADERHQPSSLV
jgi:FixJ family two-component response regulator